MTATTVDSLLDGKLCYITAEQAVKAWICWKLGAGLTGPAA
jgi:hypothetical protein